MEINFVDVTCQVRNSQGIKGKIPCLSRCLPKKTLVDHFSVTCQANTLGAIMGPSGSGKTSLLLSMSGRYGSAKVRGMLEYGDERIPLQHLKKWGEGVIGFVPQKEYLWSHLTVRETLRLAALLYLPATFSVKRRLKRADDTMAQMELSHVANVLIGDADKKGISSGERRRLAIGIELISLPKILLVDEPTTGLDATAALKVMQVLKKVAYAGCTVLATVHQPRKEIYAMLDQVIYIKAGQPVFYGTILEAKKYFMNLGFDIYQRKTFSSSVDTIISNNEVPIFSKKSPEEEEDDDDFMMEGIDGKRVNQPYLVESTPGFKPDKATLDVSFFRYFKDEERKKRQDMNIAVFTMFRLLGYVQSFFWLSYRELLFWWRNKSFFIAFLVLNSVVAPILGTVFVDLGSASDAVLRCQSLLVALVWLSTTPNVCGIRLAGEHWLLKWEVGQGLYSELPLVTVRFCFDALIYTLYATLFTTGWYWVCDFSHEVGNYFYYVCLGILQMVTVATASKMIIYFIPSLIVGNTLLSWISLLSAGCAGYAVTYPALPKFWKGLFWANPTAYYTMGTYQMELGHTDSGKLLLDDLDFPITEMYYIYPLVMIGFIFIMFSCSHCAFRFLHKRIF